MAEKQPVMPVNDALQEIIKFKNTFRSAERLEEALNAVAGLEGQASARGVELKELAQKIVASQKELTEITETVNRARTDSKANIAKIQAEVDAKKKSAAEDMADMDKEYEEARVRANEKLAAQLQAGRDEVEHWTKDLSDIQKKYHRLEADMQLLEQRKAQA